MTEQEIAALVARNQELEQQLERVTKSKENILREKKALEHRRGLDPEMAARRQQMRDLGVSTGIDDLPPTDRVVVPRHATPAQYREAKERAAKLGVPLTFSDDAPGDPTQRNFGRDDVSKVKVVETDAAYYANQALQRSVGVAELSRRASAAGKSLRIFRSIDDLKNDPEAVSKHARIEEAGDPETLVFGG
jgi:hypothetical protein